MYVCQLTGNFKNIFKLEIKSLRQLIFKNKLNNQEKSQVRKWRQPSLSASHLARSPVKTAVKVKWFSFAYLPKTLLQQVNTTTILNFVFPCLPLLQRLKKLNICFPNLLGINIASDRFKTVKQTQNHWQNSSCLLAPLSFFDSSHDA